MSCVSAFTLLASMQLVAASFAGRLTWFEPQQVACPGQHFSSNSDSIVAMNGAQFSGSCGKCVNITYKGKTVNAKVVDECPSKYCAKGFIDASKGVFGQFEGLDVGVLQMSWVYAECGSSPSYPLVPSKPSSPSSPTHNSGVVHRKTRGVTHTKAYSKRGDYPVQTPLVSVEAPRQVKLQTSPKPAIPTSGAYTTQEPSGKIVVHHVPKVKAAVISTHSSSIHRTRTRHAETTTCTEEAKKAKKTGGVRNEHGSVHRTSHSTKQHHRTHTRVGSSTKPASSAVIVYYRTTLPSTAASSANVYQLEATPVVVTPQVQVISAETPILVPEVEPQETSGVNYNAY